MMITNILASLVVLLASCVDAFTFCPPQTQQQYALVTPSRASSTWLLHQSTEDNDAAPVDNENDQVIDEITPPKEPSPPVTDILNSPVFLQRKLEVLKADIAKADEKLIEATKMVEIGKTEWATQLDDLQKEYKTIQERMNTQSKKGNTMATVQVAREMLKAMDATNRAFGAIKTSNDEEAAIEAEYKEAYNQILTTFENLGIEVIETVGKEFDYQVHQAVMQKPSDDYDEGIVCEELQKGFKIGDTLIRASMVVVAA